MLLPAATESVITSKNAHKIKARILVEGANSPTTPPADDILFDRGVFVIPDILANAGGVTVSYFEWVQDRQGYFWQEAMVNERLKHIMVAAFDDVVRYGEKHNVNNRIAAYMLAIDRVAFSLKLRGIYACRPERGPRVAIMAGVLNITAVEEPDRCFRLKDTSLRPFSWRHRSSVHPRGICYNSGVLPTTRSSTCARLKVKCRDGCMGQGMPVSAPLLLACILGLALACFGQSAQPAFDELLKEAELAQSRKDFHAASQKYREAARLKPSAEIFEKLGLSCFLAGSYPQAVEAFSDALRGDSKRWPSQLFLGVSLYKMNRFQDALPHIAEALQLDPQQNETRYWLGCTYHALGSYEEAIAQLREAATRDSQNLDVLYALAETFLDYSTVLLERLSPGTPSEEKRAAVDQQIRGVASNTSLSAESWTKALDGLRTLENSYAVVLKSPQPEPEALFALSRVYGQLGQLMAEKVWELQPDSYRSHELLGESYDNQKNYQMALTEYQKALRSNPDAPGVHYAVGHAYWEMKRFSEAVPELEKELALNPYHPSANYVLAISIFVPTNFIRRLPHATLSER